MRSEDGWNLIAILNPPSSILQSFVWGSDLTGFPQGAGSARQSEATAGGVGRLVEVSDLLNGTHFAAYDGNGNVAAFVDASSGNSSAVYEYAPFGELLRATGPMAKANPFRFSTKYQDDETDFLYYGYRYYNVSTGRWISRDLIEEDGGLLLYGFVANDAIDSPDFLGKGTTYDPNDPTTWQIIPGVWISGGNGTGKRMPAIGTGYSDLGTIEYRKGLPILSTHPAAAVDEQVHIIILEKWNGTGADAEEAARLLKEKLGYHPIGDYVWHHEEVVTVGGKQGVRMVLVPQRLNSISHNGPASWRRAALGLKAKAGTVLSALGRCVAILGVVSYVTDPGDAIAGPFGGITTFGDATTTGAIQRQIDKLQDTSDPQEYRKALIELRKDWGSDWLKHLLPLIDKQLRILDSVSPPSLPSLAPRP